eukprot:7638873-Heterocapsa_arctica.AAC.1
MLKNNIQTERTHRWKKWVENSWAHKKKDIYTFVKGTKSSGPLIVIPGGSAQIADRLKEAEKAWGGLWAVDADELPEFENQPMEPITEDEIRRV